MVDAASRSRSRSPRLSGQTVQATCDGLDTGSISVCLVLGGPGSGKTSIGQGLQDALGPSWCHVSSGEVARLATAGPCTSPVLQSISRQLGDRRRRKAAGRRLRDVVLQVLADVRRSQAGLRGFIIDGVRAEELLDLERVVGRVVCVLRLSCPLDLMTERLVARGGREGDDRFGLSESGHADKARVKAYAERSVQDDELLSAHFGVERGDVVQTVDVGKPLDYCIRSSQEALCRRVDDYLRARETKNICIDWAAQVAVTAARLDRELFSDGRPRPVADTPPLGLQQ